MAVKMMCAKDIRASFFNFFKDRQHALVGSCSTIPLDSDLLFTDAGINQFKHLFMEDKSSQLAKYVRLVNSQKCIRAGGKHNELNLVGKDLHHHTFFEMLCNFSFGSYNKKEACSWAYDYLINYMKLDKSCLYVTYFSGNNSAGLEPDNEAKDVWISLGMEAEKILPFGMDNFLEMGERGPCGPCTKIHFDRVGGRDAKHMVNKDDPEVIELWNISCIEYIRESDGSLKNLTQKSIDSRMGLERLVAVVQNKRSNYDTDLFVPLFEAIHKASQCPAYQGRVGAADIDGVDMAYRVLADHARTLTVILSDGGRPDNTSRGCAVKNILQRAVWLATEKMNAPHGMFGSLVDVVVLLLGDTFPEVQEAAEITKMIMNEEEEEFSKTFLRGLRLLERHVQNLGDLRTLPGEVAWRMYKSYGFTIELTSEILEEKGVKIEMASFEEAKAKSEITDFNFLDEDTLNDLKNRQITQTSFKPVMATIVGLVWKKQFVVSVSTGMDVAFILDCTSFCAKKGHQIRGFIVKDENECRIKDVLWQDNFAFHFGVIEGVFSLGDFVKLIPDKVESILPGIDLTPSSPNSSDDDLLQLPTSSSADSLLTLQHPFQFGNLEEQLDTLFQNHKGKVVGAPEILIELQEANVVGPNVSVAQLEKLIDQNAHSRYKLVKIRGVQQTENSTDPHGIKRQKDEDEEEERKRQRVH